jgi:hypothetical protein
MQAWRASFAICSVMSLSACAESLLDPEPPSVALTTRDSRDAPVLIASAPAVVSDDFWQAAARDFVQPRVLRKSVSLGFIGDEPIGGESGLRGGGWRGRREPPAPPPVPNWAQPQLGRAPNNPPGYASSY